MLWQLSPRVRRVQSSITTFPNWSSRVLFVKCMNLKLKIYLKKKFNRPIYRGDVIDVALQDWDDMHKFGIYHALTHAMSKFDMPYVGHCGTEIFFPLFTHTNAVGFGARPEFRMYWWPESEWNTRQIEFLKWMKKQYKDDKTDLRKLYHRLYGIQNVLLG